MFVPDTASARTVLFAFGTQPPFAAPVDALSLAIRSRGLAAICVKSPPTNRSLPDTARANTVLLAPGFQAEATAPDARMWARFARGWSPTVENEPPMNQPPDPSAATALIGPSTSGNAGFG